MREYFLFILAFKTANTLRSLRFLKVKINGKLSSHRELVKFKQLLSTLETKYLQIWLLLFSDSYVRKNYRKHGYAIFFCLALTKYKRLKIWSYLIYSVLRNAKKIDSESWLVIFASFFVKKPRQCLALATFFALIVTKIISSVFLNLFLSHSLSKCLDKTNL